MVIINIETALLERIPMSYCSHGEEVSWEDVFCVGRREDSVVLDMGDVDPEAFIKALPLSGPETAAHSVEVFDRFGNLLASTGCCVEGDYKDHCAVCFRDLEC